jgi:protein-S-isoprenylcysteine O-methyltransferase Ste14
MIRLSVLSVANVIRNPVRQALLYPWLILTVEWWARARLHVVIPASIAIQGLGAALITIGVVVCLLAVVQFVVEGAGTPEPHYGPTTLVVHGVFRFTRNPMYGGMATILVGEAIAFASFPLLIYSAYWLRIFTRRVRQEERGMYRRFGETYLRYCASTPRWLPGRTGRPPAEVVATIRRSSAPPDDRRRAENRLTVDRMLQRYLREAGQVLLLLAVAGYINSYLGIFSRSTTPFLWFASWTNELNAALGLTLIIATMMPFTPGFRCAPVSFYRLLLGGAGLVLIGAAVFPYVNTGGGVTFAFGTATSGDLVESVIQWVVAVNCLYAATELYWAVSRRHNIASLAS